MAGTVTMRRRGGRIAPQHPEQIVANVCFLSDLSPCSSVLLRSMLLPPETWCHHNLVNVGPTCNKNSFGALRPPFNAIAPMPHFPLNIRISERVTPRMSHFPGGFLGNPGENRDVINKT